MATDAQPMKLNSFVFHNIINMVLYATMIVYSCMFGAARVYTDIYPVWLASTASVLLLLVHTVVRIARRRN